MKNACILFLLNVLGVFLSLDCKGQDLTLAKEEKELSALFNRLQRTREEKVKLQINDTIVMKFRTLLERTESYQMNFDSLKNCGKVISPDGVIRFFTWNVALSDLSHRYFGFLQINRPGKDGKRTYFLNDTELLGKDAEYEIYTPDRWYGCLIYKVLHNRYKGEDYYTLLALDYNNVLSNKKIIDILWFGDNGEPMFGKPVFQNEKGVLTNRVIFEYNAQAVMGLKWNESLRMIVYDHLSPIKPEFEGNFKFYGPDFSFDAFRFDKGFWIYVPDVNVLNE